VTIMPEKNETEERLSLPQVKKIMEAMGEETLDQLQRRTFEYVSRFSKFEAENAEELVKRLVTEYGLDEAEAVQVINCAPRSIEELRVFLAGGRKIIETAKLQAIVALINEHRKLK